MIQGITLLLGFQLAGEILSYLGGGRVPGPVIGLALLALALLAGRHWRGETGADVATGKAADGLLAHLGLLFVPAGVGVIQHLDLLRSLGPAILFVLVVSTLVTLLVTVWTFLLVKTIDARWRNR